MYLPDYNNTFGVRRLQIQFRVHIICTKTMDFAKRVQHFTHRSTRKFRLTRVSVSNAHVVIKKQYIN